MRLALKTAVALTAQKLKPALMKFDGKALVDTAPLTMLSFPRSLRQSEVSRTSSYGGDMNK